MTTLLEAATGPTPPASSLLARYDDASGGPRVLSGDEIAPEVVTRVVTRELQRGQPPESAPLDELIHETVYCEEQRLVHTKPGPRTERDRAFVLGVRRDLARSDGARQHELVYRIVQRYVDEIGGTFDPHAYRLATHHIPTALGGLLNHLGNDSRAASRRSAIDELASRIRISGDVDALRRLARIGTVVLAPSHVSNLDSVVLGWAIYRLGLPPFAYGAGVNLFTNALIGFFMRNLGAYTVDRKKSDPLYRETLKEYSTVLLARGQHSLFFAGGTRSRSGAVERKLKLGLLGTAPVAFRRGLEDGSGRRIFVVPCTLTYPLVLEAVSLIDDFLRAEGGARYIEAEDEFERPLRWFDFLRAVARLDLVIHVHFGHAIDVVGNDVEENGESLDPHGRRIDPGGYFVVDSTPLEDAARDAEYTRMMGARLVEAFRRDTVAVPTSVLAFAVFERLRRARAQPDLFRLLGSIHPDTIVPLDAVIDGVRRICAELVELDARHGIRRSPELDAPPDVVVRRAIETFAAYRPQPLDLRGGRLIVSRPNLLFYYRNRLDRLGLLGTPELIKSTGHLQLQQGSAR